MVAPVSETKQQQQVQQQVQQVHRNRKGPSKASASRSRSRTMPRRFHKIHRCLVVSVSALLVAWLLLVCQMVLLPTVMEGGAPLAPTPRASPWLSSSSSSNHGNISSSNNNSNGGSANANADPGATTTSGNNTNSTTTTQKSNNNNSNNNNNNDNNNNHHRPPAQLPKLPQPRQPTCSSPDAAISILSDLTEEQRNPTVGKRWMVRPPTGGNLHLVCCDTTKGSFHVLLHEKWAPIGVPHMVAMLENGYFATEIPLFRCTDACQFGLSSNASLTRAFDRPTLVDDPLWLPTGPEHRFSDPDPKNKSRTKRYPKGVWTHAGGGRNSRGVQFVLTLKPNKYMGGGSPWEVPLGEVVEADNKKNHDNDNDGFVDVSLPDLYTGYGEKGPSQGLLRRKGAPASVREEWPLLDYLLSCSIVDRYLPDDDDESNSDSDSDNNENNQEEKDDGVVRGREKEPTRGG